MSKNLLIVFVKNIKLGQVKTRLAKSIGNEAAFEIYKILVKKTELAIRNLDMDKYIYFSDAVIETEWKNNFKTVQEGHDLGERMKNAFKDGFNKGYEKIILIGSDLPDITSEIIFNAFESLNNKEVVFGPAMDGGYYLIGMKRLHEFVFDNKPWSTAVLLKDTLKELKTNTISVGLMETLNDIDTFEDLKASSIYKTYLHD
jgi:rSAM/selenodomain-associated transferase 1